MIVNARVEIQKGSRYKYEMDLDGDILILDRVITLPYPTSYGFFPRTLSEDFDALDLFLLSNEQIPHGALCEVIVLGAYRCIDGNTFDHKLIVGLNGEEWESTSSDLAGNEIVKIREFLDNYKENFKVIEFVNKDDAIKIYENSVKAFKESTDKIDESNKGELK